MSEVAEIFEGEENQEDPIYDAFSTAISEESDEDDVKLQMISAGATFKNVTRLYNEFLVRAGLAMSKSDRDAVVVDTLEGLSFDTEEEFTDAVSRLQEAVTGATERSAAALVRAYAKKNDLEVWVKPKGEGSGRPSFAAQYYDFLASNPTMDEETARSYIMGEGDNAETSDNVKRHESHYLNIWKLVNRIATA